MGEESDHVHIIALSDTLGVPIRVVYLDRSSCDSGNLTVNHHDFVPSGEVPQVSMEPLVTMLYRPGHYDILYAKWIPSSRLVSRCLLSLSLFQKPHRHLCDPKSEWYSQNVKVQYACWSFWVFWLWFANLAIVPFFPFAHKIWWVCPCKDYFHSRVLNCAFATKAGLFFSWPGLLLQGCVVFVQGLWKDGSWATEKGIEWGYILCFCGMID